MTKLKRVYWDACVWISLINEEPDRVANCQDVVVQARRGELEIWTSSLSLVEVFKKKCNGTNLQLELARDEAFQGFIQQDFVKEVQVDHIVGVAARKLLREHSSLKKSPDAIHLATAALYSCDEFQTYDKENLLPLDGMIQREDGVSLKICEPPTPAQGMLGLELPAITEPEGDASGYEELPLAASAQNGPEE